MMKKIRKFSIKRLTSLMSARRQKFAASCSLLAKGFDASLFPSLSSRRRRRDDTVICSIKDEKT